ncbi:MAG TPA: hypothetical protein H9763_03620 [Candidatus Eisenbergiella merdigallinarum]|uniref:Uncharacterized protein n=1 Tax=Candidatus Eisenbergiella merdigallinarum TaxID=2838552 RepID=A0A9D2MR83_9FIRM|nr:hypothetical protein [Candidatus Eisenbergiella merdigallinarum]
MNWNSVLKTWTAERYRKIIRPDDGAIPFLYRAQTMAKMVGICEKACYNGENGEGEQGI